MQKIEELNSERPAVIEEASPRALIWDHEFGHWVIFTEAEIEKRWPEKKP